MGQVLVALELESLDSGRFVAEVNEALVRLQADIAERPYVPGPRKLSVKVTLSPMVQDGEVRSVKVEQDVDVKLPSLKRACVAMMDGKTAKVSMLQVDARQMDLSEAAAKERALFEARQAASE